MVKRRSPYFRTGTVGSEQGIAVRRKEGEIHHESIDFWLDGSTGGRICGRAHRGTF